MDPLTVLVIAAAFPALLVRNGKRGESAAAVVAIALYLAYVIRIGGCFMSGRLLTLPLLLAALVVFRRVERVRAQWILLGLIVASHVLVPRAPVKMSRDYRRWSAEKQGRITDERGYYQDGAALLFYEPGQPYPRNMYTAWGRVVRRSRETVHVATTIGFAGFAAGPRAHLIDCYGLADPLLARLSIAPGSLEQLQIGHFRRLLPAGYIESCRTGENLIVDPALRAYYDELCLITKGPVFAPERWRAIVRFNVGAARVYGRPYEALPE